MRRSLVLAVVVSFTATVASAQAPSRPQTAAVPNVEEGAQLFGGTCGFCHQDGGRAPGRGPVLAGTERSDDYLLNRIKVGKEGAMPAYGRAFSEQQLKALVAYIRSLKAEAK
jgi:mono/diheme cytochrome c family protein